MSTEMLRQGGRGWARAVGVTAPQFLYTAIPQGFFSSQFVPSTVKI